MFVSENKIKIEEEDFCLQWQIFNTVAQDIYGLSCKMILNYIMYCTLHYSNMVWHF